MKALLVYDESLTRWLHAKEGLTNRALGALHRSLSYRNFNVACAVLARRTYGPPEDQYRVFTGANVKVCETARPICAEMVAILSAQHAGYTEITGLVVVGTPQADHESGLMPKTLHVCGECRRTMKSLSVVKPTTRIFCVRVDSQFDQDAPEETSDLSDQIVGEEMSFRELCEFHTNGNEHR